MATSIKVYKYSSETLKECLSSLYFPLNKVERLPIYNFLCSFLNYEGIGGHNTSLIVKEHNYISNSYLNDYGFYYNKCFRDYEKFTNRIHFFNTNIIDVITEDDFINLILDPESAAKIENAYIGYIVVKPLSNVLIGATLLKPYEKGADNSSKRYYNTKVDEKVNLFGKEINFKSLVFQPQDIAVSACATNSLWSAFHFTWKEFKTKMPSPSHISEIAGISPDGGRMFPQSGLDNYQISKVIDNIGLCAEIRVHKLVKEQPEDNTKLNSFSIKSNQFLKRFIYAYNRIGIPVLLGYSPISSINNHLVTVVGYKINTIDSSNIEINLNRDDKEIICYSDFISELYAHDDQFGPYCMINLKQEEVNDYDGHILKDILETKFVKKDGLFQSSLKADIRSIIIPVDPLIRIRFEDVYNKVSDINYFVKTANKFINQFNNHSQENNQSNNETFIWDIFLEKSTNYRSKTIFKEHDNKIKKNIILTSYPLYIWVARLKRFDKEGDKDILDIIFDATDIPNGFFMYQINYYNDNFKKHFIDAHAITYSEAINDEDESAKSVYFNLSKNYFDVVLEDNFTSQNTFEQYQKSGFVE